MNDELLKILESLGADGIQAFYVYIALDYISIWALIGLCIWGARTVWGKVKDDL